MPDDIKFDVIYFADKPETRKSDIEALGGRVFKIDPPSPKDLLTCLHSIIDIRANIQKNRPVEAILFINVQIYVSLRQ